MGDLVNDDARQAMPVGEKNIAYKRTSDGYRARGVVLLDEDGVQSGTDDSPLSVDLGENVVSVSNTPDTALDITQIDLRTTFTDILKELKKMNLQLAIMTDNSITNQDVEV